MKRRCITSDLAIAHAPHLAEFPNGRGNILLKLGRFEEALMAYDKAMQLDPHFIYSYNGKGFALQNLSVITKPLRPMSKRLPLIQHFPQPGKTKE